MKLNQHRQHHQHYPFHLNLQHQRHHRHHLKKPKNFGLNHQHYLDLLFQQNQLVNLMIHLLHRLQNLQLSHLCLNHQYEQNQHRRQL
jgi:hypothetical protein